MYTMTESALNMCHLVVGHTEGMPDGTHRHLMPSVIGAVSIQMQISSENVVWNWRVKIAQETNHYSLEISTEQTFLKQQINLNNKLYSPKILSTVPWNFTKMHLCVFWVIPLMERMIDGGQYYTIILTEIKNLWPVAVIVLSFKNLHGIKGAHISAGDFQFTIQKYTTIVGYLKTTAWLDRPYNDVNRV